MLLFVIVSDTNSQIRICYLYDDDYDDEDDMRLAGNEWMNE